MERTVKGRLYTDLVETGVSIPLFPAVSIFNAAGCMLRFLFAKSFLKPKKSGDSHGQGGPAVQENRKEKSKVLQNNVQQVILPYS
jgi:hypothetical protein